MAIVLFLCFHVHFFVDIIFFDNFHYDSEKLRCENCVNVLCARTANCCDEIVIGSTRLS